MNDCHNQDMNSIPFKTTLDQCHGGPEFGARPVHVIEHRRYQITSDEIYVTLASVRKSKRGYGNVHERKNCDMFQILCPLT
jgi:hypothetical protein